MLLAGSEAEFGLSEKGGIGGLALEQYSIPGSPTISFPDSTTTESKVCVACSMSCVSEFLSLSDLVASTHAFSRGLDIQSPARPNQLVSVIATELASLYWLA